MRTKNSIKNAIITMILSVITMIVGFIAQAVFIKTLGIEYVGLKGLFSTILSMLALAELGFGSAIVFNLYKPLAENNKVLIKSLTYFYKKLYFIIALIVLFIGLIFIPFIPKIVGETIIKESLHLIFLLYLIDSVCSYFFTYKRSVLYSDQKNYIINIVNIIVMIVLNVIQILILLITKNFFLYIIIKIIFRILENVIISFIVNKNYPYLKSMKDAKPVPEEIKKDIYKKVKGLIFHKIGFYVLLFTDNIIISMASGLGIFYVGLYANYNMIIFYVNSLFGNIFSSLTASVGNLLTEANVKKNLFIYKSMLLLNGWIIGFCAISIFCLTEPVIKIWIGSKYLLPTSVLFVLVINFYIQGMRKTTNTFKDASGVFYEDRYIPIVESVLNLVFSILFLKLFGLAGVFMGTIASTSIIYLYSYPIFVYKNVLKGTYLDYIKIYLYNSIVFIGVFIATYLATVIISVENVFLQIIINSFLCLVLSNLLFYLIYRKNEYFDFYRKNVINKLINKISSKSVIIKECLNYYRNYDFKIALAHLLYSKIKRPKFLKIFFTKQKQNKIIKYLKKENKEIIKNHENKVDKKTKIPKEIYIFWWQGLEESPEIVKICVNSIKKNSKGLKVNIIDKTNYFKFVKIEPHILEKMEAGKITLTHFSDIIRFNLIKQRGGIWVDATVFITKNIFDEFINKSINSFKFPEKKYYDYVSNAKWTSFFIGGFKNCTLANFMVDIFNNYWKYHDELIDYFLVDYTLEMAYRYIPTVKNQIDDIEIRNKDMYLLCQMISDKFDEKKYNELIKNNDVHKLSYKVNLNKKTDDNKKTYYGKLVVSYKDGGI